LGRRVGLIVHNAALARRMRTYLGDSSVRVTTVDALAKQIAQPARVLADNDQGTLEWETVRLEAAALVKDPIFDVVVVDEGQDLDESGLRLLDATLNSGLADGRWRVFRDPEQNVFQRDGSELWDELPAATIRLRRNCRSTKQIAVATSILCRHMSDLRTPVDGPAVEHVWMESIDDEAALLSAKIQEKVEAYGPDNVLVVSPSQVRSDLDRRLDAALAGLSDVRDRDVGPFLGTVWTVKGLESQSVVVFGVRDLVSPSGRRFLYTACSRASVDLTVFVPLRLEDDFQAGAAWYGTQLGELLRS
jgi:hypothetical protein